MVENGNGAFPGSSPHGSAQRVIEVVSGFYGTPSRHIQSTGIPSDYETLDDAVALLEARDVAAYLCRELQDTSLEEIAAWDCPGVVRVYGSPAQKRLADALGEAY